MQYSLSTLDGMFMADSALNVNHLFYWVQFRADATPVVSPLPPRPRRGPISMRILKATLKSSHSKRWRECRASLKFAKNLDCGVFTVAFLPTHFVFGA
jgi:hypothetical protein